MFQEFLREGCLQKYSRKGYQQRMFFLVSTSFSSLNASVLLLLNRLTHFYLHTKILRYYMEKPLLSPTHEESLLFLYDVTCQYAADDVASAKVIAAVVIVCYLGMLMQMENSMV